MLRGTETLEGGGLEYWGPGTGGGYPLGGRCCTGDCLGGSSLNLYRLSEVHYPGLNPVR